MTILDTDLVLRRPLRELTGDPAQLWPGRKILAHYLLEEDDPFPVAIVDRLSAHGGSFKNEIAHTPSPFGAHTGRWDESASAPDEDVGFRVALSVPS